VDTHAAWPGDLSIDSGFPYLPTKYWKDGIDNHIFTWTYAIFVNGKSLLLVTLPLLLVYGLFPICRESQFGLITKGYDARPYFILVLIMLPVILAASFTPEFVSFYPTLNPVQSPTYCTFRAGCP